LITENRYTLLLTACIEPNAAIAFKNIHFRKDPEVRLLDYEKSLRYWLRYRQDQIKSIVFIENSGYPLDRLKEIALHENIYNREVEFIQITPEQIPAGVHYGYSELEMMDYAVLNSRTLSTTDYFIKVTGRLIFPALSRLMSIMHSNVKFLSDCRDYRFGKRKRQFIVTTLLIIQRQYYLSDLLNLRHLMQPESSSHFEKIYYKKLKSLEDKHSIILRYPFNVEAVGYGAHWNVHYNSIQKRIESGIRAIFRIFFPKIRI
jgi:hypothetical protein